LLDSIDFIHLTVIISDLETEICSNKTGFE